MKRYELFRFLDYAFDASSRTATMRYGLDNEIVFTDRVVFEFEPAAYSAEALNRVLRSLWLINGVSYYKAAMAPHITVESTSLTAREAAFLSETYRLGLGQLVYENHLHLTDVAKFESETGAESRPVVGLGPGGSLVGLGGGKDSLVSTSILEVAEEEFATFSATYLPHDNPALTNLAKAVGRPHLTIRRLFDPQLMELNRAGAYNGHVPVTAIIMLIGLAAAVLSGRRRVIMSNEASAGEGNLRYEGVEINHQYSKSLEYERAFSEHVRTSISPELEVFSLLRPLGELRIAEMFAEEAFERYAGWFSSCNRNFRHDARQFGWCGACPKCAFAYLVLAPFVPKQRLVEVIGGNLLEKPALTDTYRELLGLAGHKPFECVGEIEECRAAWRMVRQRGEYPDLPVLEIPSDDYDYRIIHPQAMPAQYLQMMKEYGR
jgi:hypothetical protein